MNHREPQGQVPWFTKAAMGPVPVDSLSSSFHLKNFMYFILRAYLFWIGPLLNKKINYFFSKLLVNLINQYRNNQGRINLVAHSIKYGMTYEVLIPTNRRINQSANKMAIPIIIFFFIFIASHKSIFFFY